MWWGVRFLSTLSLRRATFNPFKTLVVLSFLSTLSLRRATIRIHQIIPIIQISIHALLAESDTAKIRILDNILGFLSTLSLRRATANGCTTIPDFGYFYPRSPCGERLAPVLAVGCSRYFYPRSPCGERLNLPSSPMERNEYFYPRSPCGERLPTDGLFFINGRFLSTLSLRRATRLGLLGWLRTLISIHALLAESDPFRL